MSPSGCNLAEFVPVRRPPPKMSALVGKCPSKSATARGGEGATVEGINAKSINFEAEAQARGMKLVSCVSVSTSNTAFSAVAICI